MKESNFTNLLVKSIKARKRCYAYKIPDAIRGPQTRFIPKKPFDVFALINGAPVAIECKQIKKYQDISAGLLETSQIVGLKDFQKAGGMSYVFVNLYLKRKKNVYFVFSYDYFINAGIITKAQLKKRTKYLVDSKKVHVKKFCGDYDPVSDRQALSDLKEWKEPRKVPQNGSW